MADVGIFPESRLLSVYKWVYDTDCNERRHGFRSCEFLARTSRREASASWNPANAVAAVGGGLVRARYISGDAEHDGRVWSAL